ncbi:energy transducer TonB [Pontibacter ramchanderi]|uniref:Protein TonB n=1 Tax=Pontibacter ramchanderi TaxID=1179743 RepID=A0A2N3U721_9BACT|nr:energy transducer TonB [Pontibacter ramchanderi]PKV62543.1 protein TonB [Pontibacter ramchanderi]
MKESYLFDTTFNNVVFATRNKAYGAYELRKEYGKHILTAALMATSLFAAGLGWPLLMPVQEANAPNEEKTGIKEKVILIDQPLFPPPPTNPEPKQETVAPASEKQVKTVKSTTINVVPDSHPGPDEAPPTDKEMAGAIIGTQNQDGELSNNLNLAGIDGDENNATSGNGSSESNEVFEYVEEMPHFEGGEAALMRHISKKIRYPRQAVTEQVEGIVIVSFVVSKTGKVTDATVLKGLGYGTEEEALRVIQSLPAWTPGRQNGKPVAVRYTLPIRFNLQR